MQKALEANDTNNEINQSIWKQTKDGHWKLYFNMNDDNKIENNNQQMKFLFDPNRKNLKLGSLVMTPKGIGRLIKLENKISTIKFLKDEQEDNFEESLILSEFPIYIRVLDNDFSNWYRIMVPANGSIESLKKSIEELKIIDSNSTNYLLIYNGSEVKDELFYDQIELKPNSKILLCALKMTQCKLSRFNITYNWWYTYNTDGITFSVNKKIKLCGLGLYGSHENKTQNGNLKIFEGTVSSISSILYEEPVEVIPSPDQNNAIIPIYFSKPINIKPQVDYTVQLISTNYCYLYYGNGGKSQIEGEKGIEFFFKFTNGSSHGTSIESGNFPEFYYYA
jgi:hypothetical protein